MRSRKRPLILLLIGIISFVALACLIYFFPPNITISISAVLSNLPPILTQFIKIPTLLLFFLVLTIFLFSLGTYIFKSKTHGVLIAGLVIIYLIFRLNQLTHPFFLIMLLALFFTLEMLVSSRGNSKP